MKRRSFLQLMAALAGVPFLPKTAAKLIKPPLDVKPGIPVGHITPFVGETIPKGWLPCDGRVLSPTEFPKLCEILGPPFKLIKLTPQPLMHAVPDDPDRENLCGWHGEPRITEFIPYSYIVKAK